MEGGLYPLFQRHHCHRRKWHEHSARGHQCKLQGFEHWLQQRERPVMQCREEPFQPLQGSVREREREREWRGWLEAEWKVRRR